MRIRLLSTVLIALIIASPVVALRITEVAPNPSSGDEYVEIWLENASGNLTIADTYANDTVVVDLSNYTGPAVIVEDAASLPALDCPVISLGSRIGNGLSNSGDAVTVTLGNASDSFSYTSSVKGESYARCLDCHAFVSEAPSPCVVAESSAPVNDTTPANETMHTCTPPTIEATDIQEDRISYRIRADEAYEYWIEDAFGGTVRERASSETSAIKHYTPTPTERDNVYLIRAKTTCGETQKVVGFVSNADPACQLTQEQVLEAVTDELATYICRPHIEQAAACETALDACEHPPERITSFYTRASKVAEGYTYRSKALSNATFFACAVQPMTIDGDALSIELRDAALANGTPLLVAIENGSVVDTRLGTKPEAAGTYEAGTDDPPAPPVGNDTNEGSTCPGSGCAEGDTGGLTGHATLPAPRENPLAKPGVRRGLRRFWNLIRTSRSARSTEPWIVPVSFGIAGLALALPRT